MTTDVVVIGGGVSGLATAYELTRRGHAVVVLERQVGPGGKAITQRIDGFLMEHGPSSVNAAAPVANILSQSLDLDVSRCELGPGVRYRYLVGDGTLRRISTQPFGFLLSDYLSWRARLRLLGEAFVSPKETDEETVADFWRRRFGSEFAERVIDPLVCGLYAAKATELSMTATFPALLDMERRYGSITRGVLRRQLLHGATMPGRRLFSWQNGVGTLPRALADRLGPAVNFGAAVRRIKATSCGFRVEIAEAGGVEARAVVVATQPHVAATLLEEADLPAAEAAAGIPAPPLAVVFLGYRRQQVAHPLDGLGYLTPAGERRALSGALFCSTMFAGRAPAGHIALAGYVGGSRAPALAHLAPEELIALARAEFQDLVGARGEPVVARVRQWPRGLPQYRPGHGQRVATLFGIEERRPGLFVTGNYLAGPSVATCLTQANETSARVHQFLAGHARKDEHAGWAA